MHDDEVSLMPCSPVSYAAGGILVVSSTTRPTGSDRYTGVRIFEADTGRELLWDSLGWVIESEPDQTYAPTLTNITGTTTLAKYHRQDGWCDVALRITLVGAGVSGLIGLGLPIAASSLDVLQAVPIQMTDTGTISYNGSGLLATTSRLDCYVELASGTYVTSSTATSSTVPHVWAATDYVACNFRYPMATRYS